MRLRYWTALILVVCAGAVLTVRQEQESHTPEEPGGTPAAQVQNSEEPLQSTAPDHEQEEPAAPPPAEGKLKAAEKPGLRPSDDDAVKWSRIVSPGESLDMLLAKAGLGAAIRAQVSDALGAEFDLRKLKPGHRLDLELEQDGSPRMATLEIDNGVNIQAAFGTAPSVKVLPPELETVRQAAETEIGTSIYAALDSAGIPTRFATDLELIFAGTLDLQRELAGGERLRIVWRENRLDDRVIGDPMIDFAELEMGETRYEIVWPDDESVRNSIFKDGQPLLAFDQPIRGARLSSPFGLRKHPVHGSVRMHHGVDFSAEHGATVQATQSGRVSFIGRRSGYGMMIEIEHAQDIQTVYAHLSAVNEALEVGQRVAAGDDIGNVGSTGTSTAPHLHYEVVVKGRAVPPLTDTRLPGLSDRKPNHRNTSVLIETARDQLAQLLATDG
ncbi:M23 family metallopeptidase [Lutimaribacter degradans]|uniref:M23 family metallopeptidase n=1 Tax=Lutimaribacter degradans TaxID=2945989 RepID=UPI0025582617|nr:M23 family metallopeptidase [Lutimaribacter sp. EGI FJ00013]